MPDRSANGMFEYAKSKGMDWGTIDTLPEIPGVAVRFDGHVGIYIGNGLVVEERGFKYGCVITKLTERDWLDWYMIPGIKYETEAKPEIPENITLGARTLRKGSTGNDVKELQEELNKLMNCGLEVDGSFGAATETAVKKFQSTHSLSPDGVYGEKTHEALMSALSDNEPVIDDKPPITIPTEYKYFTTARVNVRCGDSTKYSVLTVINADTQLDTVNDKIGEPIISENGWYAIHCGNKIGWVSGKYVQEKPI